MKIGVVVDNEFDHDYRVQKEVKLLQNDGHQVFVLCFDFGNNLKTYGNLSVTRIPFQKKIKDLLVLLSTNFPFYENFWSKHISAFTNKNNLEALHVHDLYMSKASYKGIKRSKKSIPLTLDLHENYPAAISSYQWALKGWRKYIVTPKKWYTKEAEYLKYADNIITLSESFKKDLLSRFPLLKATQIFVHPNMPDLESFQEFEKNNLTVDYKSELPTLFYFGVVAKRRGIISILPWLKELIKEGILYNILIIGPVDKADSKEFYKILNDTILKKYITYISWADVKYLPAYLKKIQIGLAPFEVNAQHDSGVANKLFQYMYGEIPILATECKAQKELIESTNCGLVYSDFEGFKKCLIQFQEENFRNKLGKNGKSALLKLYLDKADRKFLEIYKHN